MKVTKLADKCKVARKLIHCNPGDVVEIKGSLYVYVDNCNGYLNTTIYNTNDIILFDLESSILSAFDEQTVCGLVNNIEIQYRKEDINEWWVE